MLTAKTSWQLGEAWRLTAACVVQGGRLVSELSMAEAFAKLAASGPLRGGGTALQRALRRQVGTDHAFQPALAMALYNVEDRSWRAAQICYPRC